jgi:hypothetical protein
MKIFFEEYHYAKDVVEGNIPNHFISPLKNGQVKIPYVGYSYSRDIGDTVFVLPKVFINKDGKAFGEFLPEGIVDTNKEDNPLLTSKSKYYDEIFNLSTWIYRAIARYRDDCSEENISEFVDVLDVQSNKGGKSITWIEIILRLVRFSREHQNLFTFIARMNSQGNNKIHWNKTINRVVPMMQDETPIYMRFINKKKTINFDEDLLVLFYSVLEYLSERYRFKVVRNINFPVDTRWIQRLIDSQKGTRLLRSIRKKYFKDELVELWNLLYMFFERSQYVAGKGTHHEALMIRNFNLVFEAMIDALISDDTKKKRNDLKDQPDGKIVDHIYRYESLMSREDEIYYIGDSKYYQEKNDEGEHSIFKQFTYAKNVIQMNMDIFKPKKDEIIGRSNYFDPNTEGYNVTPNFFIRGFVNSEKINYSDAELNPVLNADGSIKVERRQHHANRIFDRDTLFVQKYNINFLYVLSAYATNSTDESLKKNIQDKFRQNLLSWLADNYRFFVIKPRNNDLKTVLDKHFRTLLGKVYSFDKSSVILGLQSKGIDEKDSANIESDLFKVYTEIQADFEFYRYDVIKAEIGELYTGERIERIDDDEAIVDYIRELMRFNPQLFNQNIWVNLIELFGKKYWGMNDKEWLKLIQDYKFEQSSADAPKLAADEKEDDDIDFPVF